jgi:hypothetical protein
MPDASQYGQIDFRKQVIMMTPPVVRSLSMVDWLHALISPLDSLMSSDWIFIYDQYILGHLTSQKMVMQAGLNALFKIPEAEPQVIVETFRDEGTTLYVFNEAEGSTSYVFNDAEGTTIYVLNEAEATQPLSTHIIVKLPTAYDSEQNQNKLAQQIEILKPVGRTYQIVVY